MFNIDVNKLEVGGGWKGICNGEKTKKKELTNNFFILSIYIRINSFFNVLY